MPLTPKVRVFQSLSYAQVWSKVIPNSKVVAVHSSKQQTVFMVVKANGMPLLEDENSAHSDPPEQPPQGEWTIDMPSSDFMPLKQAIYLGDEFRKWLETYSELPLAWVAVRDFATVNKVDFIVYIRRHRLETLDAMITHFHEQAAANAMARASGGQAMIEKFKTKKA